MTIDALQRQLNSPGAAAIEQWIGICSPRREFLMTERFSYSWDSMIPFGHYAFVFLLPIIVAFRLTTRRF